MNLKTLISLKFAFYLIACITIVILTSKLSKSNITLEKENKVLYEQKDVYERILALKPDDITGKAKLYNTIETSNSNLQTTKINTNTNYWLWIYTIFIIIAITLFNWFNLKIEKLKSTTKDKGQML
jgi:hypothetical protein